MSLGNPTVRLIAGLIALALFLGVVIPVGQVLTAGTETPIWDVLTWFGIAVGMVWYWVLPWSRAKSARRLLTTIISNHPGSIVTLISWRPTREGLQQICVLVVDDIGLRFLESPTPSIAVRWDANPRITLERVGMLSVPVVVLTRDDGENLTFYPERSSGVVDLPIVEVQNLLRTIEMKRVRL